jgi:hypothetical protein
MAGLIVVFSALGGTTGSIITGSLFEAFDGTTAFYFSLVPIGVLMFALWRLKKCSAGVIVADAELAAGHLDIRMIENPVFSGRMLRCGG